MVSRPDSKPQASDHVDWQRLTTSQAPVAAPVTSRQAGALRLDDVRLFSLAGYRGPVLLILNEIKRAGALDVWAEDEIGNRIPYSSPALNLRGAAAILRVFYRSPLQIAECPACCEIRQIVAGSRYCAPCDAVQSDGITYQRVTPPSQPYPISPVPEVPSRWLWQDRPDHFR